KQRKVTIERVDELSKLLQLNPTERNYFKNWIERSGMPEGSDAKKIEAQSRQRKDVSTHILSDWINVYVKDCFQLPKVQQDPGLVHQYLASYARPQRIQSSIDFLIREGHLRKTLDGKTVVETNLAVANPQVPSKKIRQFHKGALGVAKVAMDLFPVTERVANTLVVPLNDKSYLELTELIREFSEKIQDFAARNDEPGERLYQLIVNLSPTGGKIE
ncbi:MAG: TIGR02147 family protein, partial [Bdellovibrionaceae bacterium]|nr:TIGR02147 family protein [Pseudobdellovibrionaceae bacterium]